MTKRNNFKTILLILLFLSMVFMLASTEVFAAGTAHFYAVTRDSNGSNISTTGGTVTPASGSFGFGSTAYSNATARSGYTFLGWTTTKNATTYTYTTNRITYTIGAATPNSDRSFYAIFAKNYTITYDANGGIGAPSSQTKTHGVELTLSSTEPTREGYTFIGWGTSDTATTATYQPGDSYTSNSARTLYAVWEEKTATLTYNNGGHGTAPSSVTMTYTGATNAASAISASGYTFTGWKRSDNNNIIQPGAQVKAANTEPTALTLTAQWTSTMTVTATPYVGTYDGSAHSAKIRFDVAGATVKYQYGPCTPGTNPSGWSFIATNADTDYTMSGVTRTKVGTTHVGYRIEKTGYETVYGTTTITLNPVTMTVTPTAYTGYEDGSAHSASIRSSVSGTTVCYGTCTHEHYTETSMSYCMDMQGFDCCSDENQDIRICSDCGWIYVYDDTVETCEECCDADVELWAHLVDVWVHPNAISSQTTSQNFYRTVYSDTVGGGVVTVGTTNTSMNGITRAEAGTTTVYYTAIKENYTPATGSTTITILEPPVYAVLENDGDFIIFKSSNTYTNNTIGTFTDIDDNTYTGRIFADFIDNDYSNTTPPWENYQNGIIKVYVAQEIYNANMTNWFLDYPNLTEAHMANMISPVVVDFAFGCCENLEILDIRNFTTLQAGNATAFLFECHSLKKICLGENFHFTQEMFS